MEKSNVKVVRQYMINYNDYCKFEKHFNREFNI